MPEGVSVRIYAPNKWHKRPLIVLTEDLIVDDHCIPNDFKSDCMSSGWYAWTFYPPIGPEFKRVLLHDLMRRSALNLKERWAADKKFIHGVKSDGVGKVRLFFLYAVYPHSVYRTIHLYFKDLFNIPRKEL